MNSTLVLCLFNSSVWHLQMHHNYSRKKDQPLKNTNLKCSLVLGKKTPTDWLCCHIEFTVQKLELGPIHFSLQKQPNHTTNSLGDNYMNRKTHCSTLVKDMVSIKTYGETISCVRLWYPLAKSEGKLKFCRTYSLQEHSDAKEH